MSYLEKIEITLDGVSVVPFDEISFSDKVEMELALATSPNEIKLVCFECFAPITSGNVCVNHKDLKGGIYNG